MEILLNTWPVFDQFRGSFLIGEMIWNFADFQTDQSKIAMVTNIPTNMYTHNIEVTESSLLTTIHTTQQPLN